MESLAINQHNTDEQLIDEWLILAESTKKHAEIEVGELRARVQILRDLSVLLLAYGKNDDV